MPPVLCLDHLSVITSTKSIFSDVSFELHRGEILAVMGPSGIGKSMLTKAIGGFLPEQVRTRGKMFINGHDISDRALICREPDLRPAFIFQDALQALNPLLSVGGQLSLAMTGRHTRLKHSATEQVLALLAQLGFSDPNAILSLYPSQLSGGQRQRICVAIGLLSRAPLLIADEPTSALDPITEREILSLLFSQIKQNQLGGVLITHDLHTALLCDKMLVIDDGKMIAYGTPQHALNCTSHTFCRSLRELIL